VHTDFSKARTMHLGSDDETETSSPIDMSEDEEEDEIESEMEDSQESEASEEEHEENNNDQDDSNVEENDEELVVAEPTVERAESRTFQRDSGDDSTPHASAASFPPVSLIAQATSLFR
jgi:hypothetical protein